MTEHIFILVSSRKLPFRVSFTAAFSNVNTDCHVPDNPILLLIPNSSLTSTEISV